VNKVVKEAFNVAFDASTALALVTFQSEDRHERWRRSARSACRLKESLSGASRLEQWVDAQV
jgi:hypothetical protein